VLLIFDLLAISRAPNSRNQGSPPQGASLD
jgi:hypothetical protein